MYRSHFWWRRHPVFAHAAPSCGRYGFSAYETRGFERRERARSAMSGLGLDFGVRRPLRFLRDRLDLDEVQTRELATILDRLKVARRQAQLDAERTLVDVADVLRQETTPDEASIAEALAPRNESQQALQTEVSAALHAFARVLDPDQRREFAYLLNHRAFKL